MARNRQQTLRLGQARGAHLGVWLIEHRWWVIVATLLVVAVAATGLPGNSFTSNYRIYFSEENPQLDAFQTLENTFNKSDNILIILESKQGDFFQKSRLAALRYVTRQAWQLPYVNRVDSITNFQHSAAVGDELHVGDLLPASASLDAQTIDRLRSRVLAEPLLVGRLISPDGRVTGINVTAQINRDSRGQTPAVVTAAQALADEVRARYPELNVYLTGVLMLDYTFMAMSQQDARTLLPLGLGLMLLLLAALLRSAMGAAAVLLIIVLSIVVAMGTFGYSGVPLSAPSAVAPVVILTVAVANSVHIVLTTLSAMSQGLAKRAAIVEGMRVNLQPVTIASLTTMFGFLSLNFSDSPPFAHLGNAVALGVLASLLLAITTLPACLFVLPLQPHAQSAREDAWMRRLAAFVVARRRGLLGVMLGGAVALLACLPLNSFNDVFVHYFDPGVPFRDASDFAEERLTGVTGVEYAIHGGGAGAVTEPGFMADVEALGNWLRAQPEVLHVSSYTDIMKRLNRNMHGDDPAAYRLPDDAELAAQFLLLYEMSLPYGLDLNDRLDIDKSATRMSVRTHALSSHQILDLQQRVQAWLSENAPHIERATGTGTAVMFSHIGLRNSVAMIEGLLIALLLICVLLIIALRSLKIGSVSVIPNLLPPAMGFGIWGLVNGEVGLGLSVVACMSLGIVVDDTVHFLSKYLRARREKDYPPAQAVGYAFTSVGRALLVTSVVLILGFAVLATSRFEVNASMGQLTATIVALALATDFLLLPPLLMLIDGGAARRRHRRRARASAR